MGRVRRSDNPHRTTSEDTYGYTETIYDGISRVRLVKTYDQANQLTGTIETQYSGSQATVTDQAGKKRRSITDALGRMKQVDELNMNGTLYASTTYQYNALDNLVKVSQESSQANQYRYFMYDSLSRLIRVRIPEQQINPNISGTEVVTQNSQ